jgi:hypothetical protein
VKKVDLRAMEFAEHQRQLPMQFVPIWTVSGDFGGPCLAGPTEPHK